MEQLPMAPAWCALTETSLAEQLARYRNVGRDSVLLTQEPWRLVVAVGAEVPDALIDELIAVERGCCPFFELDWRQEPRRLTVSVRDAEQEPALSAIAAALDPAG
jgi:hypothetical protein